MPELPEVETVRRSLQPMIGATITQVSVHQAQLRHRIPEAFAPALEGRTVRQIDRRGKYLLFRFTDTTAVLLAHLGMSGTLILQPISPLRAAHDHVVLHLSDGQSLTYNDPRRFGLLRLGQESSFTEIHVLGPEPLSDDFNAEYLFRATRTRTRPIKNILLDQHIVAGIGNIYASEILFQCGVRPSRQGRRLTRRESLALIEATRQVLGAAIDAGGSSISDYRDGSGRPGYFQMHFAVYDKRDTPCRVCATPIRQTVQTGRSSFYCPSCQQ